MTDFQTTYNAFLSLSNLTTSTQGKSKKEAVQAMENLKRFLKQLGQPEKKLNIIHVTGTSGKGSTVRMIHQILHTDDRQVASYTSPHMTSYLERFAVGDKLVDPVDLTKGMNTITQAYETFLRGGGQPLSFFQLSIALAFTTFVDIGIEWLVLEVGCGGRYDGTNIIPTPAVAVITNVDKDHEHIIGPTLKDIATEKAGIIKKNGVVFCGESRPQLRAIFKKEAIKQGAALFFVNPPSKKIVIDGAGEHQQHNAALAQAACAELGIHDDVIQQALSNLTLPGCRFEIVQEKPTIILDGAHSPAKIGALAKQLKSLGKPVHILFGCTSVKEGNDMLKALTEIATTISTTRFTSTFRKVANPVTLLKHVPKAKRGEAFLNPLEALTHVKKIVKKGEIIVVTGSLYLTGELRTQWISEEQILKTRQW